MTLVIPNADKTLLELLKTINKKLVIPYEILEKKDIDNLDDILNSYQTAQTYEEVKQQMDKSLKHYLEGKENQPLGTSWN